MREKRLIKESNTARGRQKNWMGSLQIYKELIDRISTNFFLRSRRIRVNLQFYESKPTDKREQYDWYERKTTDKREQYG